MTRAKIEKLAKLLTEFVLTENTGNLGLAVLRTVLYVTKRQSFDSIYRDVDRSRGRKAKASPEAEKRGKEKAL